MSGGASSKLELLRPECINKCLHGVHGLRQGSPHLQEPEKLLCTGEHKRERKGKFGITASGRLEGHFQDCPQSVPQRHSVSLLGTSWKHRGDAQGRGFGAAGPLLALVCLAWRGCTHAGEVREHLPHIRDSRGVLHPPHLELTPCPGAASPRHHTPGLIPLQPGTWAGKAQWEWGGRMD